MGVLTVYVLFLLIWGTVSKYYIIQIRFMRQATVLLLILQNCTCMLRLQDASVRLVYAFV
jgi:hypothetical protein